MYSLGIKPSHSRPRVSNDNAFAESLFRTAKYHPLLPQKGFETLQQARQWNESFTQWYNHEHRHSALRSVTPQQKHTGQDVAILKARQQVYHNAKAAKAANPKRWIQNKVRNCEPVTQTTLNPTNQRKLEKIVKKTA